MHKGVPNAASLDWRTFIRQGRTQQQPDAHPCTCVGADAASDAPMPYDRRVLRQSPLAQLSQQPKSDEQATQYNHPFS